MKLLIFNAAIHSSGKIGFEAIIKGCRAAGDDISYTDDMNAACDVAVMASGVKGGAMSTNGLSVARKALIERFGKWRLILESATIRQGRVDGAYWRLSTGGFLCDEATFAIPNDPGSERWEWLASEHGINVQPWSHTGESVLIVLQKPSDASLRGMDMHNWARAMIAQVRQYVDWPIVVRKHPLDKDRLPSYFDDMDKLSVSHDMSAQGLMADLIRARAVVTFNSLTAIESICAGKATWAMDRGSMAYPVANHNLDRLTDPWLPGEDEIDGWLHRLAYTQWSVKEIEGGEPWTTLKLKLSGRV